MHSAVAAEDDDNVGLLDQRCPLCINGLLKPGNTTGHFPGPKNRGSLHALELEHRAGFSARRHSRFNNSVLAMLLLATYFVAISSIEAILSESVILFANGHSVLLLLIVILKPLVR